MKIISVISFVLFFSTSAFSSTFVCNVSALIGMGFSNEIALDSEKLNQISIAEDFPIACGIVNSSAILFCTEGEIVKSPYFKNINITNLLNTFRTDVNNQWAQTSLLSESFFVKFLNGKGSSATGYIVSCIRN